MERIDQVGKDVAALVSQSANKFEVANKLNQIISESLGVNQPVAHVIWVPIGKVRANDYNPNKVADIEMGLLYKSIKNDGYTQPIVTVYDPGEDAYIIVDGFHRYSIPIIHADILESIEGHLPIVVISKGISDRMAATVRHNRARGVHTIAGMSNLVFSMLADGVSDDEICYRLSMERDELLKLKHITGFSKLYSKHEYTDAWGHIPKYGG